MKVLAVLLCTAALSGCSLFSSKKKEEPAPAAAAAAAAPAASAAVPAAAPAAKKDSSGGFLPPGSSGNVEIDSIVVVVNDDVITQRELSNRIKTVSARMKAQNVQMPDPADLRRQLLERMIVERSQLQLAKEMGVRVDDLQLDRAIARIAEAQKMNIQQLRDQMEKDGTPYASFREEIREEIIMQRLREHEVDGKIQISDAEVDSFIAAEKAAAAEQFEINISQIMVRIPDNASAEVIAQRRARAEEVMRQLRTGADFAKMAATYSDASDALQGGSVGWRQPERLPPVFAEALVKLKPGQVTPIIKSTSAFHILKAVDRRSMAEAQAVASVQQTHARHILIKITPTMSAADAKRKLLELKERLDNQAAKFEDLARLVSNDSSASKGGDLGWLSPGDAMPEFEAAMNALKIGEVSEPVETSFGVHLIEVMERKTDDVSKERERNNARQALRDRKLEEATESWQREVRDRAYVEYRNEDDKAANANANK
ncbi:peptidylprolyl isomerase [Duganella sp. sic0402]|uniref:peptidylprolyl isomerase n=1 Tax=Duganella sp. sic0402 TaxID=2854786 RepID=UPI001C48CDCE|nr:peptidylprolyl isomerase [Duganella sp. sic0402]MBV7538884.1 peptidylprolyl isomerase [Duganella sp. sic0402]